MGALFFVGCERPPEPEIVATEEEYAPFRTSQEDIDRMLIQSQYAKERTEEMKRIAKKNGWLPNQDQQENVVEATEVSAGLMSEVVETAETDLLE